jgi:hypothetical protein
MPTNIRIQVDGAVILYLKNGEWNLVFSTERCHQVKLFDPINRPNNLILAGTANNRRVSFSSPGTPPAAASPPSAATIRGFMNLADGQVHDAGNLEVVPFRPPTSPQPPRYPRKYVHMTIPYGELTILRTSLKRYCVRNVSSDVCFEWQPGPAEAFEIVFALPDHSTLSMDVADVGGGSPIGTRRYSQSSEDIVLTINNRCNRPMGYNDSEHIYDWVADKRDDRRFEWGDCQYVCPHATSEDTDVEKRLAAVDGNCDPVMIDPPPGP